LPRRRPHCPPRSCPAQGAAQAARALASGASDRPHSRAPHAAADPLHQPARAQAPTYQPAAPAGSPLGAIPSYGGRAPDGNGAQAPPAWGVGDVPTPREMVALLDQHVVGQAMAKKVLSVGVHTHFKRVGHEQQRQRAQAAVEAAAHAAVLAQGPPPPRDPGDPLPLDHSPWSSSRQYALASLARADPAMVSGGAPDTT
jgi:ATP-dependent Clp protease ATP-binding subunit ClpX